MKNYYLNQNFNLGLNFSILISLNKNYVRNTIPISNTQHFLFKFIRKKRLVPKIWEARKTTRYVPKTRKNKSAPAKTKNLTKGGKVVRSKKKVDVWK